MSGPNRCNRTDRPRAAIRTGRARPRAVRVLLLAAVLVVIGLAAPDRWTEPAQAQQGPPPEQPVPPVPPEAPAPPEAPGEEGVDPAEVPPAGVADGADEGDIGIDINVGGGDDAENPLPSNSILIILLLTVLALVPSLLILMTGFTRIVIVLSLVRNALGLQAVPPNQVIVGLSLFLALFVMSPTLTEMNDVALQPLLAGELSQAEAWDAARVPLKDFMLENTRREELALFVDQAEQNGEDVPATPQDTPLTTLIPAFLLSELKTAFIIGFVVFVPFLVLDLVVSAVLMSLGMMMLPPVFVSLPFKILLFVMVGGWTLVAESLLGSFQ